MRALAPLLLALACGDTEPPPEAPLAAEAPVPAPPSEAPEPPAEATAAPAAEVASPGPSTSAADFRTADLPPGAPQRVAARHIVIPWKGTVSAPPELRRTRAEARALIDALAGRLAAGEDFDAVAREASEGPSAERGGHLGAFGQGAMHPAFEEAVWRLAPGERSGVVETPFGFHLVERLPLEEVKLAHLVVQWGDAHRSSVDRTREEAEARMADAQARIAAGEDFSTVAAELSDGPSALRGGDLGWFQRDQLLPPLEEAAFALRVGEVSAVVESPSGLHLLRRVK